MASTRTSTDGQHEPTSSELDKTQKRFVPITSAFGRTSSYSFMSMENSVIASPNAPFVKGKPSTSGI